MLPTTKKRIVLLCCLVIIVWLLFRYTLDNGIMTSEETATRTPGTPILVTVFYEALCPDSKHFITKQLLPSFKAASSLMEVVLVPYGKATTLFTEGSSPQFDCQHGPIECQANIYHACAIEVITDPQKRLDVVSCMISDNRLPKEALSRCAREYKLESTEMIQKCHDSSQGSELMKMNGEATRALRPSVTFIPTITLDGSQGKQAAILKNLMGEICKIVAGENASKGICTK